MSRVRRVFLIVAAVCIVLGIILASTAYALAGNNFQALSTVQEKTQQHYSAKSADINSITFRGVEDDVEIVSSDVDKIDIDFWQDDSNTYNISENAQTGQLTISQDYNWRRGFFIFNFNFNWNTESHPVIITVPKSFDGDVAVRTVSGDVNLVPGLKTLAALEVSIVSGAVSYELDSVDRIKIESVSGSVAGKVTGAVDSADFSAVSSYIEVLFGSVHTLDVQIVSGEALVLVLDKPAGNCSLKTETISGNIDVSESGKAAANQVFLKSVSGDIKFRAVPSLDDLPTELLID